MSNQGPPTYDNITTHDPTPMSAEANRHHDEKSAAVGHYGTQDQQIPQNPVNGQQVNYNAAPQQQQQQQPPQQPQPYQSSGPRANHYPNAIPLQSLEKDAAVVDCPNCGNRERTITTKMSGGVTHCSAILCCLCLCLGCIPYLFSEFKDTLHKCGSCQTPLAEYHRSGSTEVLVGRTNGSKK